MIPQEYIDAVAKRVMDKIERRIVSDVGCLTVGYNNNTCTGSLFKVTPKNEPRVGTCRVCGITDVKLTRDGRCIKCFVKINNKT